MYQWATLAVAFSGWSLEEIQRLSFRERKNWLEIGRELGRVVRK
jgi:hypothetical protein